MFCDYPSSATVSFLRPLARRRLRTIRPFFVDILTRKPCVFARRRVLGWKVRLPFAILILLTLMSVACVSRDGTLNTSRGSRRVSTDANPNDQIPPSKSRCAQPRAWGLGFGFCDFGCVTVAGSGRAPEAVLRWLRFLPQDFHTCGKHCGKAGPSKRAGAEIAISRHVSKGERPREADFTALA
jgi:hypothetical protein